MRILDFSDSFESSTEPTSVSYAASQIAVVPTGTLVSDNAQDALVEINEKVDTKLDASKKGAVNGVAELDAGGKIPSSQIPGLALVTVSTVANITARNALTVESGDVAFVTSEGKSYVYDGSSWVLLNTDTAVAAHSAQTTGVHGVTGNLVGTTDTQTLTNKTLTAPVINSPTGLVKADVGLSAVDNTSDADKNAATATLTNKTLTAPAINGANLNFGTATNTNRLKLPDQTTVGLDLLTDVAGLVAYDTSLNKPVYNNGSAWVPVGSGAGSGGINYITNADGESNTTGWNVLKQSGGTFNGSGVAFPVDITWTRNTTTPLRATGDFLLTKGSGNFQGNYVSFPFTLERADVAKVFSIKFNYKVASGTFADGDARVYIYDTSTSTVIEPSQRDIKNVGIVTQYAATFQTPSSANTLELVLFLPNSTSTAWSLGFEDFSVGPQNTIQGAFISDWISYTPTATNFGTVTITEAFYRRVGDSIHLRGRMTLGTTAASVASISLPSGLSVDSTKELSTSYYGNLVNQASASNFSVVVGGGDTAISFGTISGTSGLSKQTGTTIGASGNIVAWNAGPIPIQGWSSGVTYSEGYSGRAANLLATKGSGSHGTNNAWIDVASWTTVSDTFGAFNATTGEYTIKESDYYDIDCQIMFIANSTGIRSTRVTITNSSGTYGIYGGTINGSVTNGSLAIPVSVNSVYLRAGDVLKPGAFQNSGGALNYAVPSGSDVVNWFSVKKSSASSAIAAGEKIKASYSSASNSLTAGTTTQFVPTTRQWDTHGSYSTSTGRFTAQRAGHVTAVVNCSTVGAMVAGGVALIILYKNGAEYKVMGGQRLPASGGTGSGLYLHGTAEADCVTGDYFTIGIYVDSGVTGLSSNPNHNYIEWTLV